MVFIDELDIHNTKKGNWFSSLICWISLIQMQIQNNHFGQNILNISDNIKIIFNLSDEGFLNFNFYKKNKIVGFSPSMASFIAMFNCAMM
jgi:hypothetical protein